MIHPSTTFCFAELQTPDVNRAAEFYGSVFGWNAAPITNDFHVFRMNGDDIIGMRRARAHRLIGHVAVDSVDRVMARALELGARLDTPPLDTPGVARTAVLADPDGAVFGV